MAYTVSAEVTSSDASTPASQETVEVSDKRSLRKRLRPHSESGSGLDGELIGSRLLHKRSKEDDERIIYSMLPKVVAGKCFVDHGIYYDSDDESDDNNSLSRNTSRNTYTGESTGRRRSGRPNTRNTRSLFNFSLPKFSGLQKLNQVRSFQVPYNIYCPTKKPPKPFGWKCSYKNIWVDVQKSEYVQRRHEQRAMCNCSWICGENCLNRMLQCECDSGTCPIGKADCGNRAIQVLNKELHSGRAYAKGFEIFETENGSRGFGLKVVRAYQPRELILEYTGEVITQPEMQRRLAGEYKTAQNYYFLSLGLGLVIDSAQRGSPARFVNHSCEPNAQMQKWYVDGMPRIGLFAGQNGISAGTEVLYDYNFAWFGDSSPQRCLCGSASCRGFITKKGIAVSSSSGSSSSPEPAVNVLKAKRGPGRPRLTMKLATPFGGKHSTRMTTRKAPVAAKVVSNRMSAKESDINHKPEIKLGVRANKSRISKQSSRAYPPIPPIKISFSPKKKRGRGRPRKNPVITEVSSSEKNLKSGPIPASVLVHVEPHHSDQELLAQPRRRGRPKGSRNKHTAYMPVKRQSKQKTLPSKKTSDVSYSTAPHSTASFVTVSDTAKTTIAGSSATPRRRSNTRPAPVARGGISLATSTEKTKSKSTSATEAPKRPRGRPRKKVPEPVAGDEGFSSIKRRGRPRKDVVRPILRTAIRGYSLPAVIKSASTLAPSDERSVGSQKSRGRPKKPIVMHKSYNRTGRPRGRPKREVPSSPESSGYQSKGTRVSARLVEKSKKDAMAAVVATEAAAAERPIPVTKSPRRRTSQRVATTAETDPSSSGSTMSSNIATTLLSLKDSVNPSANVSLNYAPHVVTPPQEYQAPALQQASGAYYRSPYYHFYQGQSQYAPYQQVYYTPYMYDTATTNGQVQPVSSSLQSPPATDYYYSTPNNAAYTSQYSQPYYGPQYWPVGAYQTPPTASPLNPSYTATPSISYANLSQRQPETQREYSSPKLAPLVFVSLNDQLSRISTPAKQEHQ